jgi:RNA polymerase sporulation-specific sigma factor
MELTECNDEALAALVCRSERSAEAFGVLLERTMPVICARVDALADGCGAAQREDLVQEGVLAFLSAISSYRPERGASFRTFASVCVKNWLISVLRRGAAQEELLREDDLPANWAAADPQDIVCARETVRHMREVIREQLSPLERNVLEHYLAGERYDRIARALRTSSKTVDNALQRVRRKLCEFL